MQARKVTSDKKLKVIKAVLNVDYEPEQESEGSQHGATHHRQHSETFDEVRVCLCATVLGLAWCSFPGRLVLLLLFT